MASTSLLADLEPPVFVLDIKEAFEQLSLNEKLYAHHMSKAAFSGTRILLNQVSPESEKIFDLIIGLARWCNGNWKVLTETTRVSVDTVERFLEYAAAVLDSVGNYRGYGDRKILPRISMEGFKQLCSVSQPATVLFEEVRSVIFSPEPESIGYPDAGGMSTYYAGTSTISKAEIKEISRFLLRKGAFLENTRLRKKSSDRNSFEVLIASTEEAAITDQNFYEIPDTNTSIEISYRDHANSLVKVCESIRAALNYVSSDDQALYLRSLLEYFRTGDVLSQKAGSVAWVKDASPPVETVIGFIEAYRDPSAIRREWLALVAIQNKAQTRIFETLSDNAESFIREMPWIELKIHNGVESLGAFENDHFVRPDFVSLEVLSFCVSNCWTGITGPNFPDVRAEHGRKNIYFSNRASAVNMHHEVPFIPAADQEEYRHLRALGFTTIVAIHELIGHGCGKTLEEVSPGKYNFDYSNLPTSPISHQRVITWYKPGETPKSIFGGAYAMLNECLAESIALYLIPNERLQKLMGVISFTNDHRNFTYHTWLQMVSMALKGLSSYDPASQKWGQSHDRARFGILKCLVEAGEGLLGIQELGTDTSQPDLEIILNRDLIPTIGHKALRDLILHLQVYRCTADVSSGTKYMENLTVVHGVYERWRDVVLAKRQKRPLFLQTNTVLDNESGDVVLKEYPATKEGLIQSWVDREL